MLNATSLFGPFFAIMERFMKYLFLFLLWLSLASIMPETAHAQISSAGSSRASTLIFPQATPLRLLQPLDDSTYEIAPQAGINIIFEYYRISAPWLLGTAAGFAILQGVVAGVQIMYGGGPESVENGKTRFTWALAGLLLVGLAGVILRILNPTFYT